MQDTDRTAAPIAGADVDAGGAGEPAADTAATRDMIVRAARRGAVLVGARLGEARPGAPFARAFLARQSGPEPIRCEACAAAPPLVFHLDGTPAVPTIVTRCPACGHQRWIGAETDGIGPELDALARRLSPDSLSDA